MLASVYYMLDVWIWQNPQIVQNRLVKMLLSRAITLE